MNGRYEVKEEDGKQTLLIKNLKLDDAGEFTCKIGDRETSAKLQVDEGLENNFSFPHFDVYYKFYQINFYTRWASILIFLNKFN